MLIHLIGIYGRDLDTLLLRFKDESFTGSVFRLYPFQELSLQQVRQNYFQIFYFLLQEPSLLIVFFSDKWRRHAFFLKLFFGFFLSL